MEFIVVGLAIMLTLLVAKKGSSKGVSKPKSVDPKDDDTTYG